MKGQSEAIKSGKNHVIDPKTLTESEAVPAIQPDSEAFYRYLHRYALREKGYSIFVLAAFNILLLIPDMILINSIPAKIFVVLLRLLLSAGMLVFYFFLDRFGTFRIYSRALSALELFGMLVFLFVLACYPNPDFLIQTMGMILIFIIYFMFPNHRYYVISVSFISACCFILLSSFRIQDLSPRELIAGSSYLLISGILCAFGARGAEKYRLRHFSSLEALRSISTTDLLTQTHNRVRLEHDGNRWIRLCREHEKPLSLAFLDLDNLKEINDMFGHLVGDKVLIETANRIGSSLTPRDIVCRWGGDEFVILLPGLDIRSAVRMVEKIRDDLVNRPFPGGIRASCSIGVTQMKEESTLETMIHISDQLMYAAKRKGKNRIEFQL